MQRKYNYIVVDIADRYYEEGHYAAKFETYKETKDFLEDKKLDFLIEKLDFLESIKESLYEYNGVVNIVVSNS